jgi:hypothetical protein
MRSTIKSLLESHGGTETNLANLNDREWLPTPKESTRSPDSDGGVYDEERFEASGNSVWKSDYPTRLDHRNTKHSDTQRLQSQERFSNSRNADTQLRELDDVTLGMEFILRYLNSHASAPLPHHTQF